MIFFSLLFLFEKRGEAKIASVLAMLYFVMQFSDYYYFLYCRIKKLSKSKNFPQLPQAFYLICVSLASASASVDIVHFQNCLNRQEWSSAFY